MTESTTPRPIGTTGLFAVCVLSGFSGMVYQSIWSHYANSLLGHTASAGTLALGLFMAGLAAGAWLSARLIPRLVNLPRACAVVGLLSGVISLVFHPVVAVASPSVGWLAAIGFILAQSVLMGSALPLLGGAIARRVEQTGTALATLFFTYALGAALGVLIADFTVLGVASLRSALTIAGLINFVTAAYLWRGARAEPAPAAPRIVSADMGDGGSQRFILLIMTVAGAAVLMSGSAWIRLLELSLGSAQRAIELIVGALLLGFAGGALLARRRIETLSQPLVTLSARFAIMAALTVATLPLYDLTFEMVGGIFSDAPRTDGGYHLFNAQIFGIAALMVIPTTFMVGMTVPVITRLLVRRIGERAIGQAYACGITGGIIGLLVAVHALLLVIGPKGVVVAGALLLLVVAVVLGLQASASPELRRARWMTAASAAAVVVLFALVQIDPMRMAAGVAGSGLARLPDDSRVEFQRTGKSAMVSVIRQGDIVAIATDGTAAGVINLGAPGNPAGDEVAAIMAAALPLGMHPSPRRAANIGIGSGLTSHALLASPVIESLDTIEVEPLMAEAARAAFIARTRRLFEDARSHIQFDGARAFLSAATKPYDVIISQPPSLWMGGSDALYSREFYAEVVRHLNDDGLLVQRIRVADADLTVLASILKAMGGQFQDYAVYAADNSNLLIVARPQGSVPRLSENVRSIPSLAAELDRVGLKSIGDFELRLLGDRRMFGTLVDAVPVPANSDFEPYVERVAPRMSFAGRDSVEIVRLGLLSTPLAEIFGQSLTAAASDAEVSARLFARQEMAIAAAAILAATVANAPAEAPEDMQAYVKAIRSSAAECTTAEARTGWLNAVHAISARTTPFLPAASRAPIWQLIRQQGCLSTLGSLESNWFDLLEAIGLAKTDEIAAHGEQMFVSPLPAINGSQILEALIATAAAQVAVGKPDEARQMLNAYVPTLQNAGDFWLALRLVISQAQASEHHAR